MPTLHPNPIPDSVLADWVLAQRALMENRRIFKTPLPLGRHPTLVVGDSLVVGWPWEADFICRFGSDPEELLAEIDRRLGDEQYEQIVLWYGNPIHFRDDPPPAYEAGLRRIVERLAPHTTRLRVLGPVPTAGNERQPAAEYAGAPVLNMAEWYRHVGRAGGPRLLTYDGVHLTRRGFLALQPELERFGITLEGPAAPSMDN